MLKILMEKYQKLLGKIVENKVYQLFYNIAPSLRLEINCNTLVIGFFDFVCGILSFAVLPIISG